MLNIMLRRKFVPNFVATKLWLLATSQKFYKECFKIFPIMLALCPMLSETYYAQNYAGIIGLGLSTDMCHKRGKGSMASLNCSKLQVFDLLLLFCHSQNSCHGTTSRHCKEPLFGVTTLHKHLLSL